MPQRRWVEYPGNTANGVFTLPDNPSRRAVVISNNSEVGMVYRVGGTASATNGVQLEAGKVVALDGDLCPDGDVTLYGLGQGNSPATSQPFTVYEVVG